MATSVLDYLFSPQHFAEGEHLAVAILDGASVNDLAQKLFEEDELKYECLFSGDLEPDIAEVAPYLVQFEADSDFAEWVSSGWGEHWGVFAVLPAELDLAEARRHFRKHNMVYGPDNQPLYFRWYDPRVMRVFLPTFDVEQLQEFFGPVLRFIAEGETPDHGFAFSLADGKLVQERFSVKA